VFPNEGLWRIEREKFFLGGKITWDCNYLIRNYMNGRYLRIDRLGNITLSDKCDKYCLFRFIKFQGKGMAQNVNQFITKESYFMIRHSETLRYISIK
jgi:hypothetical protein